MSYFKKIFILLILSSPVLSFSQEDFPDDVFHLVYQARLSEKDHFSSSGKRLETAAAILHQDRANFHIFNIKDSEDEYDGTFKDKLSREYMEESIYIPKEIEKAILNGTPIVKVEIIGDSGSVVLINDKRVIDKNNTNFNQERSIFSDSSENSTENRSSKIPPKKIVNFIFNDPSIIEQEQLLECLKNNNLKIKESQKLLSAVKLKLGDNENDYYFIRGSKKNYCMAFNGAHSFQYWLIEVNDLKSKIIFDNSSDDVNILSSKSNGMNDIDVMNYTSLGIEYRYDRYKYDGNKYVLAECFIQKNDMKSPKRKKITC